MHEVYPILNDRQQKERTHFYKIKSKSREFPDVLEKLNGRTIERGYKKYWEILNVGDIRKSFNIRKMLFK